MTLATTNQGVAAQDNDAAILSQDTAADAFLSRWSDEDEPAAPPENPEEVEEDLTPDEEEESVEEDADETEEKDGEEADHQEDTDATEDGDEESEEEAKPLTDDAVVKVKVDGEELDVSVKDLKRLYGQEKALTRKTQEVAAKRKEADATVERLNASYQKLYDKAQERFKPYAEIDMLVASKQLDTEQFAALRKEAQEAYEEFRFISEESGRFVEAQKQEQQKNLQAAAKEAIKTLKADIPNWSQSLYDQIREYAIGKGLDANVVNQIVDPTTIKILHQARLYEESKKIATKKKVTAAPKKVLKPTVSATAKTGANPSIVKARQKLYQHGSVDDAADLFMSRWADADE